MEDNNNNLSEAQPEETQPEEVQPEEVQPEEVQPEETKPEETSAVPPGDKKLPVYDQSGAICENLSLNDLKVLEESWDVDKRYKPVFKEGTEELIGFQKTPRFVISCQISIPQIGFICNSPEEAVIKLKEMKLGDLKDAQGNDLVSFKNTTFLFKD